MFMGGMFKSDKYTDEKQYEHINSIIDKYSKLQIIDYNSFNNFLNELLFNQFDFVHNNNVLDVIDNFVYYIIKNIPLKDQKLLYLEQHFVNEDSPPWMIEGNIFTLKRWIKLHEKKSIKTRKLRTKEINVSVAKTIVNKYLSNRSD